MRAFFHGKNHAGLYHFKYHPALDHMALIIGRCGDCLHSEHFFVRCFCTISSQKRETQLKNFTSHIQVLPFGEVAAACAATIRATLDTLEKCAEFRKLRIGDYRVTYQVRETEVLISVLAVGPRRDTEIYKAALKRK